MPQPAGTAGRGACARQRSPRSLLPADRISYLLLLASLDAFVLYVLLVSDSASDFFEVRSKRIGAKNQPPTSRGAV